MNSISDSFNTTLTQANPIMSDLTASQILILRTVIISLAILSTIGLMFVEVTYWCFKSLRSFAFELVMWLCLSEIFFNISFMLPNYKQNSILTTTVKETTTVCSLQAVIGTLFDISSMLWTTIIGYTAYKSVEDHEILRNNRMKFRLMFLSIAFLPALIFTLIIYFLDLYGPAGLFCWIAVNSNSDSARIATIIYYAFTWLIIIMNCYYVTRVIIMLRRELKSEEDLVRKYTNKLRWYPLVQVISFMPATINRIYNLATNNESFGLLLVQGIFDSLTGLMFAVVFGFNSTVRKSLWDCIRLFCCRKREVSKIDIDTSGVDTTRRSLTYLESTINTDN